MELNVTDQSFSLESQVAVVTGAASGIGEAVARAYAAAGAVVAIVDIDAAAECLATDIVQNGGRARAYTCDVADYENVVQTADVIRQELGLIDILVNNAGITRRAPFHEFSIADWLEVQDVNVNGNYYWLKAVAPDMMRQKGGSIIFSSSPAGIRGSVQQIGYATSKAAQLGMMRSAARELGPYNITVNAVAPSAKTAMSEILQTDTKLNQQFLDEKILKRFAEPKEIAGTYLFLASNHSRYMTGQVLAIDGGRVMVR